MIVFGLLCPKIPYCAYGYFSVNSCLGKSNIRTGACITG